MEGGREGRKRSGGVAKRNKSRRMMTQIKEGGREGKGDKVKK